MISKNLIEEALVKLEALSLYDRRERIEQYADQANADHIALFIALLGENYEDDPDRKIHFDTILALGKLQAYSWEPVIQILQQRPQTIKDERRRNWLTMSLRYMHGPKVLQTLVDLAHDKDYNTAAVAIDGIMSKYYEDGLGGREYEILTILKQLDIPSAVESPIRYSRNVAIQELSEHKKS